MISGSRSKVSAPPQNPLVQRDGTLNLTTLSDQLDAPEHAGQLVYLNPTRSGRLALRWVDPNAPGAAAKISRYAKQDQLKSKLEATARRLANGKNSAVSIAASRLYQRALPKSLQAKDLQVLRDGSGMVYDNEELASDVRFLAAHQRRSLQRRSAEKDLSAHRPAHARSGSPRVQRHAVQDAAAAAERLNTTLLHGGAAFFDSIVVPVLTRQLSQWCDGPDLSTPEGFRAALDWAMNSTNFGEHLSPAVTRALQNLLAKTDSAASGLDA